MPLTPFPVKPMIRLAGPEDVGRALRLAGRTGRQAGISAARLRDLSDIVRAMTIGLALDRAGGWIGVRQLELDDVPGLEVVAFDSVEYDERGEPVPPGPWVTRLRADLDRLGGLGTSVMTGATAAGGTAVWARVIDVPTLRSDDGRTVVDVSGLLQAPTGPLHEDAGWNARTWDDHIGMTLAEDGLVALNRAALGTAETGDAAGCRSALGALPGSGAHVDLDLAAHVASVWWGHGAVVTIAADGAAAVQQQAPESEICELTLHWERSLSLIVHTSGIRPADGLAPGDDRHPALSCATLMRDHREPTPVAAVVAARVRPAPA